MPPDSDDEGANVNEWVNVVRRARLGPTVKLVALTIASYADADGTHTFPGVARLTVQCEVDYRTAQRALACLRTIGLVEMVKRGARRSGHSDEYRLILANDLLAHCDVPTPAAERVAIEQVSERERNRRERSTRHGRRVEPVDKPGSGTSLHTSPVTCESGSTRQTADVLHDTGVVPPSTDLYMEDQPPSDAAGRRTTRTGSGRVAEGGQPGDVDVRSTERRRFDQRIAEIIANGTAP